MWLLAAGCLSPPPPEPVPSGPVLWHLGGRISAQPAGSQAVAPPFSSGEALLADCSTTACVAELWRSEAGDEAVLLRDGQTLSWGGVRWPGLWRRLGTELSHCLGDPLDGPTGSFRVLLAAAPPHQDPAAQWVLRFSGDNPCELSGDLLLEARRDRVDSRGLLSGGRPWGAGGRQHALEILQRRSPPIGQ